MTGSNSPRAIHLAAGEGSRLRPITNDRPKPLVELDGKSLLERNVDTLDSVGVNDQVVVTGYRSGQIEKLGYETEHNPIYDETDMVYSLFCAEERFPDDRDLIISYGDIVYDPEVVERLLESNAEVAVVVDKNWDELWSARFDDPLRDAETLKKDDKGQILEIGEQPGNYDEIDAQYIGLIKIRSDFIDEFRKTYYSLSEPEREGEKRSSVEMTRFIQYFVDNRRDVEAVPVNNGWLELDTTQDLEMYRGWVKSGEMENFVDLGSGESSDNV